MFFNYFALNYFACFGYFANTLIYVSYSDKNVSSLGARVKQWPEIAAGIVNIIL